MNSSWNHSLKNAINVRIAVYLRYNLTVCILRMHMVVLQINCIRQSGIQSTLH
jgi:hypothetical protein